MSAGVLYYDLASPYAYLAVMRAAEVLGEAPRLQPVLVGAIFGWRGRGSWALTDQRDAGEAEIERRAAAYGLRPVVWPRGWPLNSLGPMRAAVHAERQGKGDQREATEQAWQSGVQGVPTLEAGRRLYFGDDRLEEAATATRG